MQASGVILLASDQNIEELIKKVIQHPEKQLILEIPPGNSIFRSEINLRLLKFYMEEEEKDLILKTKDPVIVSLAEGMGISTIGDLKFQGEDEGIHYFPEVEDEIAAAPESPVGIRPGSVRVAGEPRAHQYRGLVTAILMALFSLCLAGWWFMQSRAVITVYPKIQEITFTVPVKIGRLFTDEDINAAKIPARILTKESKIQVQTVTTGYKLVGETPATGVVTLINSSNQPVVLPKGSVLMGKAGVRFLTEKEVLVPNRTTRVRSNIVIAVFNGQVDVNVVAAVKGTIGNQPANSITGVSEKYRRFLQVIHDIPTSHGTDKRVGIVTLEDVNKGEAEARQQMELVGPEDAPAITGSEYLYLPELVQYEVIKVSYNPVIGNESDLVQTTLEYRTSVLAPAWVGINKFFAKQLDKETPPNFEPTGGRISLIAKKVVAIEKEWVQLELTGRSQVKGVLNAAKIKALVKGKTLNQAKAILTSQNEMAGSKIQLRGGLKSLPVFGFQIKVLLPDGAE